VLARGRRRTVHHGQSYVDLINEAVYRLRTGDFDLSKYKKIPIRSAASRSKKPQDAAARKAAQLAKQDENLLRGSEDEYEREENVKSNYQAYIQNDGMGDDDEMDI